MQNSLLMSAVWLSARNPTIACDQEKQRQTVLVCCNSDVNLTKDAWYTTKLNKTMERETAKVLGYFEKQTFAYIIYTCIIIHHILWTPSRITGYHMIAHEDHAAPHCRHLHRNGRARWTCSLALVQLFSESFVQKRLRKIHTCSINASAFVCVWRWMWDTRKIVWVSRRLWKLTSWQRRPLFSIHLH